MRLQKITTIDFESTTSTDIKKRLYNNRWFQGVLKYPEKAPGGGVFIFARLHLKVVRKNPTPWGFFREPPVLYKFHNTQIYFVNT